MWFATERTMSLEPIEPDEAVELYLADRKTELAEATLGAHRSRLSFFVKWCERKDIENLNELTGRKLHEYRLWRRNDGDLAPPSEKSQMDTLRVFVRYLTTIDAVEPGLDQKVRVPTITPDENSRDVMLDGEDAEEILEYLETYEYASVEHVTPSLLWRTMLRRGAAHSLDVRDYDPEDQFLEVVHRPDTGTPIKNGGSGERLIALSGKVCLLLDDWLRDRRPDVVDDHGRRPLLASSRGRTAKSTLAKYA